MALYIINIKSVIDRDGATCRNNNHFERPNTQTDRQTDKQTNGRYQTHYLPCLAADKNSFHNDIYV